MQTTFFYDTLHVVVEEELLEDATVCSKAMMMHFYGRPTTRHSVIGWIKSTWNTRNWFKVERRGKYFYLVNFHSREDATRVLKDEWLWYGSILVSDNLER